MTRDEIQDFTLRITHANKTEMIVVLYDIALTYIDEAKKALESDKQEAFRGAVRQLKATLTELMDSVDTSIELGLNILQLYVFAQKEATKALVTGDHKHLENVANIVSGLKESYVEVAKQDKSGSVMENTEKVYAGLTYNPYGKSESMVDTSVNRGYLA